jgi:hypothetical protein
MKHPDLDAHPSSAFACDSTRVGGLDRENTTMYAQARLFLSELMRKKCVSRGVTREFAPSWLKCMPSGLICASFRELLQVPRAPVKSPPPHHALSRSRLTGCSHASDQSTVTNMSIVRGNENLEIDREGFIGT